MIRPLIASVRFEDGQDVDMMLSSIVNVQEENGKRVVGVLQSRGENHGLCHCSDMDLRSITNGQLFRISQALGIGSSGCRLNPGAIADCSSHLETEVEFGCDLLVLNRFGKGESEGRGFRDLISKAILLGIPVLTATRRTYLDALEGFAGEYGVELSFCHSSILAWLDKVQELKAA